MDARVRKSNPSVFANVGVHAGVDITLVMDPDDAEGAAIRFGHDGPDLTLDFADVESMELLSSVAAEGVRLLRGRAG
jgi:hypothetical protein